MARYNRRDVDAALAQICDALGRPKGHYIDHHEGDEIPEGSAVLRPPTVLGHPGTRTNPGGWAVAHAGENSNVPAGYVIEEIGHGTTGITYPLGPTRRSAREFCEAVDFAVAALAIAARP